MNYKTIIGFLFLIFFCFNIDVKSQNSIVKSIVDEYDIDTTTDSIAFHQLYNKGWDLLDRDVNKFPDIRASLIYYLENLDDSYNAPLYYNDYNNLVAKYHYMSRNYDSSIYYYETSISTLLQDSIYLKFSLNNYLIIATLYNNLALIYDEIGLYKNAIDLELKSISETDKVRNIDTTNQYVNRFYATDYIDLGIIYSDINDTIRAKECFSKGIKLCYKYGDKAIISYGELNYGVFLLSINKLQLAENFLLKNEDYFESIDNNFDLLLVRLNIAELEYKKKNYPEFIELNTNIISLADSNGFDQIKLDAIAQMLIYYESIDSFNLAINYGMRYIKENVGGNDFDNSRILESISDLYFKINNLDSAYKYLLQSKILSDSITNSDKIFVSSMLNMRYNLNKISERNKALLIQNNSLDYSINKQRNIIFMILFLLLGVGFILFIIYRSNQRKTKHNAELEDVNKLLIDKSNDLKESKDVLEKIFTVISHDLKGPIGTANSFFELLLDKSDEIESSQREKYLEIIGNSLNSTHLLLEDILNWSRNRMGKKISISDVYVKQLVDDLIHTIDAITYTKEIAISNSISEMYHVSTDENYLKIIIRNIISNAIKFTSHGGDISISCTKNDDVYSIVIKDNGVGMSSELVSNILSGKYYNSSEGTVAEKGTGLGLIICFELANSIGAKINIESELNVGTTFIIDMPGCKEN